MTKISELIALCLLIVPKDDVPWKNEYLQYYH